MFGKGTTAFGSAVKAALDEARQRGDRRLGTEHLLLGLLADPEGAPARALGIETADARAALQALDEAALRAIGIEVGETPRARPRKHRAIPGTALTSSARAVVNQAIRATTVRDRDTLGPTELLLALADFPAVVATAAELREPHRVARYLEQGVAKAAQRFWDECNVLPKGDDPVAPTTAPRLLLWRATRVVLENGLGLLGVSAPERM